VLDDGILSAAGSNRIPLCRTTGRTTGF